ncbi:DNA primase TraC [Variovorax sp. SRS16]|uniref:toprim domain-containing protein n=1 Tax=Variovorax sp. SRS16 TaxID=282217 RepID=UPI001316C021|nr:toprim domain-containing protein [Variovorax sp. SRS16]VTU20142.1 DNA primase TraC [Variovorax sp. SRS16]
MTDSRESFCAAIAAAGINPPSAGDIPEGVIYRFNGTGKRGGTKNSWLVFFSDGNPSGRFGSWDMGIDCTWSVKSDDELTPAEREAMRERVRAAQRMRDAETAKRNAGASVKANGIWAAGIPAVGHPYLKAKAVKAHGLRVGQWQKWDHDTGELLTLQNVLYVPMRDTTGKLWSLQGITIDGEKLFLAGGKVKACYHSIGRPSGRLIIGEGYATCATVHEATGDGVAVAFNSGNLDPVARALRAKYPCLSIIVAADDDHQTPGNPGLAAARVAAAAVGGSVALPDFTGLPRGPRDSDYNDLVRLAGKVKIGGAA